MKSIATLILILALFVTVGKAQIDILSLKKEKPDYCRDDSAKSKSVIGRTVKIWDGGGVYAALNLSENFKWPSIEMNEKGGKTGWGDYQPGTGDTGAIVYIFEDKMSDRQKYIYLLKIKDIYVPVGCFYITDLDRLDVGQYEKWESLRNAKYAGDCKFKQRFINSNYSYAGVSSIDTVSETFACDLTSKGIDTIVLCKYIHDAHPFPTKKCFVLWQDKGKGYIKSFFSNEKEGPAQNKIEPFALKPLLNYFFNKKIDTVTVEFQPNIYIEDAPGYTIQVYTPTSFFRLRMVDFFVLNYKKKFPQATWWSVVSDQLSALKPE